MNILLAFSLILAFGVAPPASRPELPRPQPEPAHEQPKLATPREDVLAVAKSALGWREKTGNNDGENIERILAACGLEGTRSPYCACFVVYCYQQAGVGAKIPRSAWSPDLVANPTWKMGRGETPRMADVYGIYFSSKGRIAHVGLVEKWGNGVCVGIEGNTGPDAKEGSEADREGEGVYRRWRMTMAINCVRSFL